MCRPLRRRRRSYSRARVDFEIPSCPPPHEEDVAPSRNTRSTADAALAVWVAAHAASLARFVRSRGVEAVEDVVQETFVVAARRADAIEPGRERAFLFAVARRIAARARLRERRAVATPWQAAEPAPADAEMEGHERRALVEAMILAMPEDLREVFVAFEMEELSKPEVAALLHIPEGTAASRRARALAFAHGFAKKHEQDGAAPLRGVRTALWAHTHDWLEAAQLSPTSGLLSRHQREAATRATWMQPDEMMRLYAALDGLHLSTRAALDLGRYASNALNGRRIRTILARAREEPGLAAINALRRARDLWRASYAGGGFELRMRNPRSASLRVRVPMLRYAFYRTCLLSSVDAGMAPFAACVRAGAFSAGTFVIDVDV